MTTLAQAYKWIANSLGKGYDFDGHYGQQCFDYINAYAKQNFGVSFGGLGAIDLQTTGVKGGFTKHQTPQIGDIFVAKSIYSKYGHTGIVTNIKKDGLEVYDQNSTGKLDNVKKNFYKFGYPYDFVCYLRPPYSASVSHETNRITEHATFYPDRTIKIRNSPLVSKVSDTGETYRKGQSVKYDSKITTNGYVWISWIGRSGNRRYMAVREQGKQLWGVIK